MTTLIKDATIYDGNGGDSISGDILIRGKHITKIGTFPRDYADTCIDAHGAIVIPGLIDVSLDTNVHLSLLHDRFQAQFLKEGITTVIGGGEGISAAPVFHNSFSVLREHAVIKGINSNWRSLGEFLDYLEKYGVGINIGQCVGYSTIRGGIMPLERKELSPSEMMGLLNVLKQSFKEGAYGVSVKLHEDSSFTPSPFELIELGNISAKTNRVLSIHPRDNSHEVYDIVKRIISVSQETNASIEINHLLPLSHVAKDYANLTDLLSLKSAKSDINFDVPINKVHEIPLYSLLPPWAHDTHSEKTLSRLRERAMKERTLEFLSEELKNRKLIINRSAHPQLVSLEGKSLEGIAASRGISEAGALLDIILSSSLKTTVIDKEIDRVIFQKLISHSQSIFSIALTIRDLEAQNHFGHFLKSCQKNNWCSIGVAVSKMCSLPAKKYNVLNRGVIRAGNYADIVIMEDFNICDVFVNGSHVVQKSQLQDMKAGAVLRATKQ